MTYSSNFNSELIPIIYYIVKHFSMNIMNDIIAEARRSVLRSSSTDAIPPPPPGTLSPIEDEDIHFLRCPVHLRDYDTEEHLPHVIYPCGHTVCREVCVRESRCPLCRTSFRNHALNRSLIEVISTINTPLSEPDPKLEDNAFLRVLQHKKKIVDSMNIPMQRWNGEQWSVFTSLVNALKEHANVCNRTWIDAAGCNGHLASALQKKLVNIRKVVYNRKLLGWEDIHGLPLGV
jgi:hypothetical protein